MSSASAAAELLAVANDPKHSESGGGHGAKGVDFSRIWAVFRMMELEKANEPDFLILFESVQDVAELDSVTAPTRAKVYQVKKKDSGTWTWSILTGTVEPKAPSSKAAKAKAALPKFPKAPDFKKVPESVLGKLHLSLNAFTALPVEGIFLSNQGCDFPLESGGSTATTMPCSLADLAAGHVQLLTDAFASLSSGGPPPDLTRVKLQKVAIHPDNLNAPAIEAALDLLNERSPGHAGQAKAFVETLVMKISPLTRRTDTCLSFAELVKERGFSRGSFIAALAALEAVPDRNALFNDWMNQLQTEGMDFMTISSVRVAAKFGEWSRHFCEITDFNLVFSDKKQAEIVPADPACFFAPFYINQDGSWQAEWNTFGGMKRFNAPFKPILEYFTGVCPPEYYTASAEKSQHAKTLEEHRREYKLLERTIERFSKSVPLAAPKVNADNFVAEIEQLTKEVSDLNARQEGIRSVAVREQELLKSLDHQIHLAEGALAAYDSDAKYLLKGGAAPLICPTCHAEHEKPFLDLLEFVEDARVLRELAARLREDAAEVRRRTQKAFSELSSLNENYLRISRLLDSRKGEMKFKDVVESLGAESAFAAFEEERKQIQAAIDAVVLTVDTLETRMAELRSLKRTKQILTDFREHYAACRIALQLQSVPTKTMQLASRPSLSGSGGPRSILAYYAAIWRTVQGKSGTYDVPVVIDSPNQQAQDDFNLPAVLSFIARDLPADMQLIVGLETPTDFSFDREETLTDKYGMLTESDWEPALGLVAPLLKKMYDATLAQSQG